LPKDPHVPWVVRLWKGPVKWLGNLAMLGGILGVTLHYLRYGPKQVDAEKPENGGQP
jgi:formate dehydrogenase iron-sulfur subunit